MFHFICYNLKKPWRYPETRLRNHSFTQIFQSFPKLFSLKCSSSCITFFTNQQCVQRMRETHDDGDIISDHVHVLGKKYWFRQFYCADSAAEMNGKYVKPFSGINFCHVIVKTKLCWNSFKINRGGCKKNSRMNKRERWNDIVNAIISKNFFIFLGINARAPPEPYYGKEIGLFTDFAHGIKVNV